MGPVTATFLNHGDTASWKEHGICANSILIKGRFYTAHAILLNISGQVPNLAKLTFLQNGFWKIENNIYEVFSYVSS